MFVVGGAVSADGVPRVVLTGDAVLLELEWPADLVDALPDDVVIEMSGDGLSAQTQTLAAAERADGFVRIRFGGIQRGQSVTLTAKTGSTELVFAQDHVASDLENHLVWLRDLDELIADSSPPASSPSDDGSGSDDTPEDTPAN
jgi:hypothetical protein